MTQSPAPLPIEVRRRLWDQLWARLLQAGPEDRDATPDDLPDGSLGDESPSRRGA